MSGHRTLDVALLPRKTRDAIRDLRSGRSTTLREMADYVELLLEAYEAQRRQMRHWMNMGFPEEVTTVAAAAKYIKEQATDTMDVVDELARKFRT